MSIRKSIAWTFLAQGLYFVIQYGGSVILARLLSPKEMGVYTIALTTIGLLAMLQSLSLNTYIVREPQLTPEKFGTAVSINALLNVALIVLVLIAAPVAGYYMREDGVRRVMMVLALSPVLSIVEFPAGTLMYREMRFGAQAVIQVIKALVTAASTVYGAMTGWSYMSLAWGTLAGNLVGFVIITALARPWRHFRLSLKFWREATHFGSRMMFISGVTGVAARAPDFLIGRLIGLAPLGLYGRASSMQSMIWDSVYMSVSRVLSPSLAEYHRNGRSLRPRYLRSLEVMTGFFWPAFGGLAVLSGPLIQLLYGDQWVQAAPVLSILCVAQMIGVGLTLTWDIFAIKNEVDRQSRLEVIRSVLAVLAFYVGATQGLLFAAASRIVDGLVSIVLYGPHLTRMTDTTLRDFLAIYRRSAVLTIAATAPAALMMHLQGWRRDISLAYLLACIAAGGLAWLVATFATRHVLAEEIGRVLRTVMRRVPA